MLRFVSRSVVTLAALLLCVAATSARAQSVRSNTERREEIMAASHGVTHLALRRTAMIRDSAALASPVLVELGLGSSTRAFSYDGRYWGVMLADDVYGYIAADAVEATPAQIAAVTVGAPRLPEGQEVVCSAFASRAQAQAAYHADPIFHGLIDGNRNGIVCEGARDNLIPPQVQRPSPRRYYEGVDGWCYYLDGRGRRRYVDRDFCTGRH